MQLYLTALTLPMAASRPPRGEALAFLADDRFSQGNHLRGEINYFRIRDVTAQRVKMTSRSISYPWLSRSVVYYCLEERFCLWLSGRP